MSTHKILPCCGQWYPKEWVRNHIPHGEQCKDFKRDHIKMSQVKPKKEDVNKLVKDWQA